MKNMFKVVIFVALTIMIFPFVVLLWIFNKRKVLKMYVRSYRPSKKLLISELKRVAQPYANIDGVQVYTLDDSLVEQFGGAFQVLGIGVIVSPKLVNSPHFMAIVNHEVGHAILRHKAGRGLIKTIKQELEADKYVASKGYADKLAEYLIGLFKKDPKGYFLPYLILHFWRIVALKVRAQ